MCHAFIKEQWQMPRPIMFKSSYDDLALLNSEVKNEDELQLTIDLKKKSLPFDGISNQHFNFIKLNNKSVLNSNNQAYLPSNIPHFNYILDVTLNLIGLWNQLVNFILLNNNMINCGMIIYKIERNNLES